MAAILKISYPDFQQIVNNVLLQHTNPNPYQIHQLERKGARFYLVREQPSIFSITNSYMI